MNKKIKSLIGAVVLVMALPLHGMAAADAAAILQPGEGEAEVSIALQQSGAGQGVNALQMCFTVEAAVGSLDDAQVSFAFRQDLPGTVKRYSFNENENLLTVYVAGAEGDLFQNDTADLGTIQVDTADGSYVELKITAGRRGENGQLSSGLTLLTTGTSTQQLTLQPDNVTVSAGEEATSPDPVPTPTPEPGDKPEATQTPGATATPQPVQPPAATQQPSGGTGGSQNGSGQNGSSQNSAAQSSGAASAVIKMPGASSSAQSEEASSEPAESVAESQSASSAASSAASESESQAQSQAAQGEVSEQSGSVLPVVLGIALAAAVVAVGVVLFRRSRG